MENDAPGTLSLSLSLSLSLADSEVCQPRGCLVLDQTPTKALQNYRDYR